VPEPLAPPDARRVIREILAMGSVSFSAHCDRELAADGISEAEARDVLRGGIVEPAEFERGSWRYRVRVGRIYLVVAFRSERELVVVTGWRTR
jgi:hypothetical protein